MLMELEVQQQLSDVQKISGQWSSSVRVLYLAGYLRSLRVIDRSRD